MEDLRAENKRLRAENEALKAEVERYKNAHKHGADAINNISPEERRERAKKAAAARWAKIKQ